MSNPTTRICLSNINPSWFVGWPPPSIGKIWTQYSTRFFRVERMLLSKERGDAFLHHVLTTNNGELERGIALVWFGLVWVRDRGLLFSSIRGLKLLSTDKRATRRFKKGPGEGGSCCLYLYDPRHEQWIYKPKRTPTSLLSLSLSLSLHFFFPPLHG